ncbi:MAG: DUF434 domain-containing protein [Clostridia bacterium]|nr:DUF434 domain-containing protein [Clostridia bacterium]
MSDEVRRGFVPTDAVDFDEPKLVLLRRAEDDLRSLLNRGYPMEGAASLVGNHYQLTARQRLAIVRATASHQQLAERRVRLLPEEAASRDVLIDGLNVIITLETALSRSTVFRCMDGTVRDLAAVRGSYRIIEHTHTAIRLLGDYLEQIGAARVTIYLDAPVSNTGRLKTLLATYYEHRRFAADIELVPDADAMLRGKADIITSDAVLLDQCQSWRNAAAEIIAKRIREVRPIPLDEPARCPDAADGRIYVAVKGILAEDGRALIAERADRPGWWEFPGGTMEFGENTAQTLVREFREEMGLCVEPAKLLCEYTVRLNPAYQIVVLTYLCRRTQAGTVRLSSEHLAYQWADRDTMRALLIKDIRDALDRNELWDIVS